MLTMRGASGREPFGGNSGIAISGNALTEIGTNDPLRDWDRERPSLQANAICNSSDGVSATDWPSAGSTWEWRFRLGLDWFKSAMGVPRVEKPEPSEPRSTCFEGYDQLREQEDDCLVVASRVSASVGE